MAGRRADSHVAHHHPSPGRALGWLTLASLAVGGVLLIRALGRRARPVAPPVAPDQLDPGASALARWRETGGNLAGDDADHLADVRLADRNDRYAG